ncbi:hypothetical protein sscle_08g067380 [Sclerotinia sclerotiorum 1980 UF-70]|uniref:Uncharacterized protein n=1 Tax=Sclerotinia sclerotiorum (strain ATCC 18683 / 1980 / Ss-1) TaxID=665079 RepID=A0A1D9QAP3_SCLS1|nr:hypothetical protein sscle_08g067380 [Sclerotinia sclerotiorum 1980 UF-70]
MPNSAQCQSQEAALGVEHKPPSHRQDCNENWPKKRQHKKVAIGETWEDDENERAQDRWGKNQWQQGNISDTDHSGDISPNSSDEDDEFRPRKRQKITLIPTNYDSTSFHQRSIKDRLRKRHDIKIDIAQSQGCDRHLQTPIDNHHRYPSAFSTPSGISSKNSKSAEIPTPCNAVVYSKVQKAKPLSTCSVIIYSKVQPAMRKRRISALWTPSENKTILKMKKSGCLWK